MKKILVYGNRKTDDLVWDVSTPAKERKAFRELFKILDKDWQVYMGLSGKPEVFSDECTHCKGTGRVPMTDSERKEEEKYMKHRELYAMAKKGDFEAMKKLMSGRRDYEYESWHVTDVN